MSKESTLLLLGLLTALTQFLGLPSSWERVIFFASGATIAVLAFLLRRKRAFNLFSGGEVRADSYVQNGMSREEHH